MVIIDFGHVISWITIVAVVLLIPLGFWTLLRARKSFLVVAAGPFAVGITLRQPDVYPHVDRAFSEWWGSGSNLTLIVFEGALVLAMVALLEMAIVAVSGARNRRDLQGTPAARQVRAGRIGGALTVFCLIATFQSGWSGPDPFLVESLTLPRAAVFSTIAWFGLAFIVIVCIRTLCIFFTSTVRVVDGRTTVALAVKAVAAAFACLAWTLQMILTILGIQGQVVAATALTFWVTLAINICALLLAIALGFPVMLDVSSVFIEDLKGRRYLWVTYSKWSRLAKRSPELILHRHIQLRGRGIVALHVRHLVHRRKIELADLAIAHPGRMLSEDGQRGPGGETGIGGRAGG
ncbi:hypothetical protein [Agromyces sp. NPDC058126]|uniref:hypothetical protein n=1 Tax=Agromyces sp. NPDC058126 TaxID=3346350 RepID=UPI0036D9A2F1